MKSFLTSRTGLFLIIFCCLGQISKLKGQTYAKSYDNIPNMVYAGSYACSNGGFIQINVRSPGSVNEFKIAKFNYVGDLEWGTDIEYRSSDDVKAGRLIENEVEDLYITGSSRDLGIRDFNLLVMKLSGNGELKWTRSLSGLFHGGDPNEHPLFYAPYRQSITTHSDRIFVSQNEGTKEDTEIAIHTFELDTSGTILHDWYLQPDDTEGLSEIVLVDNEPFVIWAASQGFYISDSTGTAIKVSFPNHEASDLQFLDIAVVDSDLIWTTISAGQLHIGRISKDGTPKWNKRYLGQSALNNTFFDNLNLLENHGHVALRHADQPSFLEFNLSTGEASEIKVINSISDGEFYGRVEGDQEFTYLSWMSNKYYSNDFWDYVTLRVNEGFEEFCQTPVETLSVTMNDNDSNIVIENIQLEVTHGYTAEVVPESGRNSFPILVDVCTDPEPDLTSTLKDTSLCPGDTIQFAASGDFKYSWQINTSNESSLSTDSVWTGVILDTTDIILSGTYQTQTARISIDSSLCPYVPPVIFPMEIGEFITPNDDGQNDYFTILNVPSGQIVDLRIYDHWNRLVYESNDYQNDWPTPGNLSGIFTYILEIGDSTYYGALKVSN